MTTIPHEIIRASAGTGKTFALSDRIVRLLALGAAPETIVALTFTRKAAGEFVSAVFRKLAAAALDQGDARRLAARLQLDAGTDFSAILARVIAAMNRLQFGTLDSFFQRAASAIPFELGLSGPIQILDQSAADDARARALERQLQTGIAASERQALLDAFRAATWGAEEKQLFPRLLSFIDSSHDLFLEAPDEALWGRATAIWPGGSPWLQPIGDVAPDLVAAFDCADTLDGRFAGAMRKFVEQAAAWQPGMDLPDGTIADQLFAQLSGPAVEDALELTYYRKPCVVPQKFVRHFQRIVRHCLGACIAQGLGAARGIWHLAANYDRHYEAAVRRTGRLAFSDVIALLCRVDPHAWQPRLDSKLSHWLFDEFQDTSTSQWSVLSALVGEVLQDPTGSRSVFFVGDPKQAIYRWRGGEHRLLARVATDYEPAIVLRPLDRSFRSAPAIIELVNRVGSAVAHCTKELPEEAVKEWNAGWSAHASAVTNGAGHVRIGQVEEKDSLHDALLESLREADPIGRGLTCAILTRGNDEAAEIARALRERGFLDIAAETDVPVATDQPFTQALLALAAAAAHPGDKASRRVVEMSPLHAWLVAQGGWHGARGRMLALLAREGCEAALETVLRETPGAQPAGRFGALRCAQLLEIARRYDGESSRTPDEFVRRAREALRRETASAGRVQVMTIHKAKGLGFDFVLLPMRVNRRLDATEGEPLLVSRSRTQQVEWIIGRPPATVIQTDPALSLAQERRRIDAAYESLCVLYVALTRARHGMHIFLGPASKSEGLSAGGLIRRAVDGGRVDDGVLWQHGDARWFEADLRERPAPAAAISRADWRAWVPARRIPAVQPSRGGSTATDPAASEFGIAVHEAFAAIEWKGDGRPGRIEADVWKEVCECLEAPAVAALFQPIPGACVWRERAFDLLLDDRWVSGVFDRVVIAGDVATLVEFKTDRGPAEAARSRHAAQVALYCRALRQLTGAREVRGVIVHTPSRAVLEMRDQK